LLKLIQISLGGIGKIYSHGSMVHYRVNSLKDLLVLIAHFDKYPLITQKRADYELFKMVILLISQKEHLRIEGLTKIVAIKAYLNLGLSDELKVVFPNIIPVPKPLVKDQNIQDPHWLAGFAEGECCFYVSIFKSKTKTGYAIQLVFQITQHFRDAELMKSLVSIFGCKKQKAKSKKQKAVLIM
jgi:hypothetical protein